jgi:hypothetical protein
MKKILLFSGHLFTFILVLTQVGFSQNVCINATGASAEASSMLDITSGNKRLLIPVGIYYVSVHNRYEKLISKKVLITDINN